MRGEYKKYILKKVLLGVVLILLLFLLSLLALCIGEYNLTVNEVINTLLGEGRGHQQLVVWNMRLPRILSAIIAGASLSVAGAVMQCILRNPLASPFTMGISHGAMFGACLAILIFGLGIGGVAGPYMITIFAFLGALGCVMAVLTLAKIRNLTPEAMILLGVALSSLFTAGTMFIQYFSDELELAAMVYWTFGDLGRVSWNEIYILLIALILSSIYFILRRWDYNALEAGDEVAKSLGVDIERIRLVSMLLSSLLTAVNVAFLGIIGFIGLISPHIIRMIVGGDYRFLIPLSFLFGSVLLLSADILSRTLISPIVLPVGILTSFLGAPMFLYLLLKMYGRR
ncbi:iron ABC transporter permease [Methanothermococcus sp. SCGC AD-155-K20]|nr:iron ABC transporter permease [Methanothermococcus sp. SCGC AD-155-K20]